MKYLNLSGEYTFLPDYESIGASASKSFSHKDVLI